MAVGVAVVVPVARVGPRTGPVELAGVDTHAQGEVVRAWREMIIKIKLMAKLTIDR